MNRRFNNSEDHLGQHLSKSTLRSLAADQSNNMQQVLYADEGTSLPPVKVRGRVRALGRTIKERGEVCQWIQSMTLEPPVPRNKTSLHPANSEASDASRAFPKMAGAKTAGESDLTANATAAENHHPLQSGGAGAPVTAARALLGLDGPIVGSRDLSKRADADEEPSFAEQLSMIRQQQSVLLEKQRVIQEQMSMSAGGSDASLPVDRKSEADLQMEKRAQEKEALEKQLQLVNARNNSGIETKHRRLKGTLANHYAQRDEGTVGSLLWTISDEDAPKNDLSLTNSLCCMSSSAQRQQYSNHRHDTSSSISDLLRETSFLNSRSRHGYGSSDASLGDRQSTPQPKSVENNRKCDVKPTGRGSNSGCPSDQAGESQTNCSCFGEGDLQDDQCTISIASAK
ncbi:hypothetical protein EGW08_019102 [Elysia chlorotica]|uniref:Uncharacterized protein n=1 Tax=Elysia chlorotica TaxID=188477 RepID=A0A433SV28_ELYCH|nr:hypothetical protein EGW08_019102 [Elysia chlorotica]